MNNNIAPTFAAVSAWIDTAAAKTMRAELIASGLDKSQVKLSSYRWADLKDHSKGYLCRVLVVQGLRPDLECGTTRPRVKQTEQQPLGNFVTELMTGNSMTESQNSTYYCSRNNVDETMTA